MKKILIPKEKIIAFNTRFVYFLENEKVFRGARGLGKGRRTTPTRYNIKIVEDSIKRIEKMGNTTETSLLKILKEHGVKVTHH